MDDLNTDKHILDRCRDGEVKAQFMLYKQYSKAMYNIAIRFLNNKMDAEDILQESFVTAFEKLDNLDSDDAFGSWLKRIVINNCISHIRRNRFEFEDLEDHFPADYPEENEAELNIDPAWYIMPSGTFPMAGEQFLCFTHLKAISTARLQVCLESPNRQANPSIRGRWIFYS